MSFFREMREGGLNSVNFKETFGPFKSMPIFAILLLSVRRRNRRLHSTYKNKTTMFSVLHAQLERVSLVLFVLIILWDFP